MGNASHIFIIALVDEYVYEKYSESLFFSPHESPNKKENMLVFSNGLDIMSVLVKCFFIFRYSEKYFVFCNKSYQTLL